MSKLHIDPEHLSRVAAMIYQGSTTLAVDEAALIILQAQKFANKHNGCEEQKEHQP